MQDADDGHCIGRGLIVDRIGVMKGDAKAGRQVGTRRRRQRKSPDRLERRLQGGEEPRGNRLRCLARNLEPDFSEVGFGRSGEAES